jgi:hypothetical protein
VRCGELDSGQPFYSEGVGAAVILQIQSADGKGD